jgi:hypothetical protein
MFQVITLKSESSSFLPRALRSEATVLHSLESLRNNGEKKTLSRDRCTILEQYLRARGHICAVSICTWSHTCMQEDVDLRAEGRISMCLWIHLPHWSGEPLPSFHTVCIWLPWFCPVSRSTVVLFLKYSTYKYILAESFWHQCELLQMAEICTVEHFHVICHRKMIVN